MDEAKVVAIVESNRHMILKFPYSHKLKRAWLHWCCGVRMIKVSIFKLDFPSDGYGVRSSFVCSKCGKYRGPTEAE
jgi:hypothetical protein